MLISGTGFCDLFSNFSVSAFAADNNGGMFAATNDANNDVVYFYPGAQDFYNFVSLPFTNSFNESGMAVDNVRHRLYVSHRAGNSILVYSLASGHSDNLIHVIHN